MKTWSFAFAQIEVNQNVIQKYLQEHKLDDIKLSEYTIVKADMSILFHWIDFNQDFTLPDRDSAHIQWCIPSGKHLFLKFQCEASRESSVYQCAAKLAGVQMTVYDHNAIWSQTHGSWWWWTSWLPAISAWSSKPSINPWTFLEVQKSTRTRKGYQWTMVNQLISESLVQQLEDKVKFSFRVQVVAMLLDSIKRFIIDRTRICISQIQLALFHEADHSYSLYCIEYPATWIELLHRVEQLESEKSQARVRTLPESCGLVVEFLETVDAYNYSSFIHHTFSRCSHVKSDLVDKPLHWQVQCSIHEKTYQLHHEFHGVPVCQSANGLACALATLLQLESKHQGLFLR